MERNSAYDSKYAPAMGYQAAGTGDTLTGTAIDTRGYRRIRFIAKFGAIVAGATCTFKVQGHVNSAFGAATDITNATISVADDDDGQVAVIEVVNPSEALRFMRAAVVRAAQNITIDAIVCALTDGEQYPVTQDATLVSTGAIVSVPCQ